MNDSHNSSNAVVTCEIKSFRNYSILRQRPSEMILFQRVETCFEAISKIISEDVIAAREYLPTCTMSLT